MSVEFDGTSTDGTRSRYSVIDARLSTTDVRVGTAAELNARLYALKTGTLFTTAVTHDYIVADSIQMSMERVINWPNDAPEDVEVTGYFTALRN